MGPPRVHGCPERASKVSRLSEPWVNTSFAVQTRRGSWLLTKGQDPPALVSHPSFVRVSDTDSRFKIFSTFASGIPGTIPPHQANTAFRGRATAVPAISAASHAGSGPAWSVMLSTTSPRSEYSKPSVYSTHGVPFTRHSRPLFGCPPVISLPSPQRCARSAWVDQPTRTFPRHAIRGIEDRPDTSWAMGASAGATTRRSASAIGFKRTGGFMARRRAGCGPRPMSGSLLKQRDLIGSGTEEASDAVAQLFVR